MTLIKSSPTQLILWSWQRQEDLSYINKNTLIAPLVGTISVRGNNLQVFPRSNHLTLKVSSKIIPVIRLEINPRFSVADETFEKIILHILALTVPFKSDTIQIDFDATVSQRSFYKKLLNQLRCVLPNIKLSITALASWCLNDIWIENLPIDYAVPMLYNLGEDSKQVKRLFLNKKQWKACKCYGYIGLHQKDLFVKIPKGWTAFIFNDEPWTPEAYNYLRRRL